MERNSYINTRKHFQYYSMYLITSVRFSNCLTCSVKLKQSKSIYKVMQELCSIQQNCLKWQYDKNARDHGRTTRTVRNIPFLIEYLLWTWLSTPKLNCAYLLQPYGNVAESATSKYIDKWSTLFPFGKTSILLIAEVQHQSQHIIRSKVQTHR